MTQQITRGIKVSVATDFEGSFIQHGRIKHAFSYTITIQNTSEYIVQLQQRHWKIQDSLRPVDFVDGEGVVGRKPVIPPGTSHIYNSGCILDGYFGAMNGYYDFVDFNTAQIFRVRIPLFKLNAPFALN